MQNKIQLKRSSYETYFLVELSTIQFTFAVVLLFYIVQTSVFFYQIQYLAPSYLVYVEQTL